MGSIDTATSSPLCNDDGIVSGGGFFKTGILEGSEPQDRSGKDYCSLVTDSGEGD